MRKSNVKHLWRNSWFDIVVDVVDAMMLLLLLDDDGVVAK